MMADLFMAAAAAFVWASTGPGLVNSLAFNVMLIGSVSSLLFNGNPLLRFEGYAPLARGAAALHTHAHGMLAVHNLSRLEDLARSMASLLQRG